MTVISWTVLLVLIGACWLFSMLAAFFLGQAVFARQQMASRERLFSVIRDIWEEWKKGTDNAAA